MATDRFKELEQSHEARYKLEQELRFKAKCRTSKLLGRWAAQRLGLPPAASEAYSKRMIGLALGSGEMDAVAAAIRADFEKAGVVLPSAEIQRAAERYHGEALASLTEEYPMPLGPDHIRVGD